MSDSDSEYTASEWSETESEMQSDAEAEDEDEETETTNDQTIDRRLKKIESAVSQFAQIFKGNLSCDLTGIFTSILTDNKQDENAERSTRKTRNSGGKTTRKRTLSMDREKGVKKSRRQDLELACKVCHKQYSNKGNLYRHYRCRHKDVLPGRVNKKKSSEVKQKPLSNKANGAVESPNKNTRKAASVNQNDKNNVKYDCKLCERSFNTKSSRNSHYTGKHQVKDEKLLFFSDCSALVESTLEHHVSLKPDWFKAAAKRNMSSRACKLCEVELDKEDLKWHYETRHKVIQMAKIKDLIRLSNSDIKEVADPHKCEQCGAEFDDISKLKSHLNGGCSNANKFKNCKICNAKVYIRNYNTHVKNEHSELYYQKAGDEVLKKARSMIVGNQSKTREKQSDPIASTEKKAQKKTVATRVSLPPESSTDMLMYLCKVCDIATSCYDNVIKHCQDHILNISNAESLFCDICELKFVDYNEHRKMHENDDDVDRDSFRFVIYDYKCMMGSKWRDTFEAFAKSKVDSILSSSIYFTTRYVRMELKNGSKNVSAPYMLFQCACCKKYVDPYSIEEHVKQQNACVNQLSSYPCYVCMKQFYTQKARDQHDLTHKVPNAVYVTVLFNNKCDWNFNKILLDAAVNGVQMHGKGRNGDNIRRQSVVRTTSNKEPILLTRNTRNNEAKGLQVDARDETRRVLAENVLSDNPKANQEKVATVYKCQCGLCFERLKYLFAHLKNCTLKINIVTINCKCGLSFDRQNYPFHSKVHREGFTTLKVKEVIMRDIKDIDIRDMSEDFKKNGKRKLSVSREIENDKEHVTVNENVDTENAQLDQCEETNNEQIQTINPLTLEKDCSQNDLLLEDQEAISNDNVSKNVQNKKQMEDRTNVENINKSQNEIEIPIIESQNTEENQSLIETTMEAEVTETAELSKDLEYNSIEKPTDNEIDETEASEGHPIINHEIDKDASIISDQEKMDVDDDNPVETEDDGKMSRKNSTMHGEENTKKIQNQLLNTKENPSLIEPTMEAELNETAEYNSSEKSTNNEIDETETSNRREVLNHELVKDTAIINDLEKIVDDNDTPVKTKDGDNISQKNYTIHSEQVPTEPFEKANVENQGTVELLNHQVNVDLENSVDDETIADNTSQINEGNQHDCSNIPDVEKQNENQRSPEENTKEENAEKQTDNVSEIVHDEQELLKDTEQTQYFDVGESLLTDDEDPTNDSDDDLRRLVSQAKETFDKLMSPDSIPNKRDKQRKLTEFLKNFELFTRK